MKPNELDTLIEECLDGHLNEADAARLSAELQASPQARSRYWESASIHGLLEHTMQQASLRVITGQASAKPSRLLQWRPLTAAAAGIVFGMLCTSVVFGYVMPQVGKAITLLQESFENGPAPLVTGVPMEPGQWSGDYTEVAAEQQGVKPESGKMMLRFLRADFEGKPSPDSSHLADMYQLFDLRASRQEIEDGGAVVEVSASFNAIPFPEDEKYGCAVSIFALDAETATNGGTRVGSTLMTDALAMTRSERGRLIDRDPSTWQRVTSDLRLPPGTDFVMVRLHINRGRRSPGITFAGHYADDVRVSLVIRAPLL